MLSALLPCLSERQTTYPAGAIIIRIKMLISSFTSDDAKPLDKVKEPKERRKGRELER